MDKTNKTVFTIVIMLVIMISTVMFTQYSKYETEKKKEIETNARLEEIKSIEYKTNTLILDEILANRLVVYGSTREQEFIIEKDGTLWNKKDREVNKIGKLDSEDLSMIKDIITREEFKTACENSELNTEKQKNTYYISYDNNRVIEYCSSTKLENEFGRIYSIIDNIVSKYITEEVKIVA